MNKLTCFLIFCLLAAPGALWGVTIPELHNMGYVVVSPNGPADGGDYGPSTPSTTTSGFQEAFNYAKSHFREVYIIGGGVDGVGGNPVVYNFTSTLTIPWGQDWHNDGGDYVMQFSTITTGDCIVVDSQMNCTFKFGVINAPNLTTGNVVRIYPTSIGPDNFRVCTSSVFKIGGINGGGVLSGTYDGRGIGLHLDTGTASVVYNEIYVGSIAGCDVGIQVDGTYANSIVCPKTHSCDTLVKVNGGTWNKITTTIQPHASGSGVIGANLVGGSENTLWLNWEGSYSAGNALRFGSGANGNFIYATNLPVNNYTNSATTKTNHVFPVDPVGFAVTTPAMPASNTDCTNTSPYSVMVTMVTAGTVTAWRVTDALGTYKSVSSALVAGQQFYLEPGDKIRFTRSTAPTWKWQALR